jgi:hypothetical protein
MEKLPLYHQTARDGHGGIPSWWFGAPIVAFVYAFLAPRLSLDIVTVPDALPGGLASAMRWMVGLLLGVALVATWRVGRWVARRS